jgi:FAD-dependent urate hydroxylase
MAIEDAVVLAQCLRDGTDPATSLAADEQRRRERVKAIVAHGARGSRSKAAGPIGRLVAGVTLPLVFRYAVTDEKLAWIYDHHIEWD